MTEHEEQVALILAIDPGPEKSGWVWWKNGAIWSCGVGENESLMRTQVWMASNNYGSVLAIEMIASYGATVGRSTFETVLWIGRFAQYWKDHNGGKCLKVYRQEAKRCVCRTHKASDADVRAALITRLGEVGTKKNPGPLYSVKSHAWAALAVAVTAEAMLKQPDVWKAEEVA